MSALTLSDLHGTTSSLGSHSQTAMQTNAPFSNGRAQCKRQSVVTEHIADWTYYTQALASLWPVKAGIAAIAAWLNTDAALLYWLVAMWGVDLAFGLAEAFKLKKFSSRILKRGALKIPAYCLYILLVGAVDVCIGLAFHVDFPVVEGFLAYLVAQESVSVMGHMVHLGMPVPPIVRRILLHGKQKVEQQLDSILAEGKKEV